LKEEKMMLKKNGKERRGLDKISTRVLAIVVDGVCYTRSDYWTPRSSKLNGREMDELQRSPEHLGMTENRGFQ
jgi:hypothetical protein